MKTSIVILTYNKLEYTKQCIESIRKYTESGSYEIIIVDNHSTDDTVEWLYQQKDIRPIFNDENMGFPKGCNQGIEIAIGDNILLLNNDTVVSKNWLSNMTEALHSSTDIGAVGAITNSCSYYQSIPVNYSTMNEMQEFAAQNNISNEKKWEERLKLIGFCMLIKKSVIDKIGLLDEGFTPGNFEDDDYSFRIRVAGYKLILCRDSFVHHYGSLSWRDDPQQFNQLLRDNENMFIEKWGFNSTYDCLINFDLAQLVEPSNEMMNILEIGCHCGGTLLEIKNQHKHAELFGTDPNEAAARVAQSFANVKVQSMESVLDYQQHFFDYIIIDFQMEEMNEPELLLKNIQNILKPNGKILATFHNPMHYETVYRLITGQISRNHLNYKLLSEIEFLFTESGYSQIDLLNIRTNMESSQPFLDILTSINNNQKKSEWEISQVIVKAAKGIDNEKNEVLSKIIQDVINGNDVENNLIKLKQYETKQIVQVVQNASSETVEILNSIAVLLFEYEYFEDVLPYLQKAIELDPSHIDTLINLGYILYQFGDKPQALKWLYLIPNPNESVRDLINQITDKSIDLSKNPAFYRKMKALLRRIENDVGVQTSKEELLELIKREDISIEQLFDIVEKDIVFKDKVLTNFAVFCFQKEHSDWMIPLLEKSLQYNNQNPDTLFNLGFLSYSSGEFTTALQFLQEIDNKDEETITLIEKIKGELVYE